MKDQRQQLRQKIRTARQALTQQQQKLAAEQLCLKLTKQAVVQNAKNIAAYLPTDGEISPLPFINWAYANNKKIFVPVLHPLKHKQLWFVELKSGSPMKTNKYGILEPDHRLNRVQPLHSLDIVLLPLVAFDRTGARLGMGGGYYDRTFAYRKQLSPFERPKLIGITHQLQQVDSLPTESWDIPLSAIVTDQECINC